jgi:hypothetical protein
MLKGNYASSNTSTIHTHQQSSAPAKITGNQSTQRHLPPVPVQKVNYIEDNIDMIRNKENFYHRYPAKKYENLYSKRKDLAGVGHRNNIQRKDSNDQSFE